jgi:hypothetical protein
MLLCLHRLHHGIVGVLADADSIPTSTPLTASCLVHPLSPHSRTHIPLIAFVFDRTPQLPRHPPALFSTLRHDIHNAHSLIKGPRTSLAATLVPSPRQCWATPARIVSSRFGLTSVTVLSCLDLTWNFTTYNCDSLSSFHAFHTFGFRLTFLSSLPLR